MNLIETHQENINDLSVNKVDKVTGKELSSNDFTDHYKNFLDGFDGDIEAFLLEHKEEIEALITSEVLAAKADKSYVDSELSERDAEINLKSNKSYVDGELDKKANITYVNSELNERDTQINLKSDKTYVDTELNKKSDKTYVDNELNKKANTAHTHTESDITDLQDYALNSDVYSKSEVDELIHNLQNNIKVNGTSGIIQSDESVELYAYTKADGMPVINKKVHFYQITDDEPADEETITSNE